jgi:hypothetical protein
MSSFREESKNNGMLRISVVRQRCCFRRSHKRSSETHPKSKLAVLVDMYLLGLCSDSLLSRDDHVPLQEPAWSWLILLLLLSVPQSPLLLTSSACDSFSQALLLQHSIFGMLYRKC